MYALLTDFYPEPDAARRAELRECLRRNLALEQIDSVHLILEEGLTVEAALESCPDLLSHPKVTLVPHGKRATFDEYFACANAQLAGKRVILSNADIYFDVSLTKLDELDIRRMMICLARWDVLSDGTSKLYDVNFSQDAWIFVPPIKLRQCNFTFGVAGCENRVAFEANRAGLKVANYARTIRAHHLHLTPVRRWTLAHRLHGPARYLKPETLR